MKPRLFFLDNLRAVVIVLVIVLHASITYMLFAPEWWYVLDPDQSIGFTMLVLLVDVPLMPIMFFVAGYFALRSLERRGSRAFIREKVVRVAIPWIVGVLLLAPLVTYMTLVSRGTPRGYLEFWSTDFWGPLYQQAVYWFLGVLFAMFVILAGAYTASSRLRAFAHRVEQPHARVFLAFIALTAAGSILAAPAYGLDDWESRARLFVLQPARIAFYVGYFVLGIYAERRGWFTATGFRPELGPWGWGCVVTGAGYLAFRMAVSPTTMPERAIGSALFSAFCLTALVAGLALFGGWLNSGEGRWRTLAENSYGIYYVHPLILYPLAYLLVGLSVPSPVKVVVLVAVTLVASLAVSALVLKRLPGVRQAF